MVIRTTWTLSEGLSSREVRTRLTVVLSSATAINGYIPAKDVFGVLCARVRLCDQLSLSGSRAI
jgi:hypothetical protein